MEGHVYRARVGGTRLSRPVNWNGSSNLMDADPTSASLRGLEGHACRAR